MSKSTATILSTGFAMAWMAYVVYSQDLVELPSDLTFSCEGRSYGYYADPTTNCQVFHICLGDGDIKWSFLCPNQTIFNQQYFVCDYAVNVDCLSAEGYYNLNDNFGAVQAEERIDDSGFEERIDDSGFEDFEENAEEIEDFENVEESEVPILRK